jgi:diacylglycerol kinase
VKSRKQFYRLLESHGIYEVMKNKNFYESFKCAVKGLFFAIKTEANLRFDISAMCTVIMFALFYGIERLQWAVLIIIFIIVIGAELFNTALEKAVDTATDKYCAAAGAAKDISAAAVMVCAIGAVAAGVVIFGDIERIVETLKQIFQSPIYVLIFCALLICDAVMIFTKHKK